MRYRPKIYTASKLHNFELFRQLRSEWIEFEFTSRWIDMVHLERDSTTSQFESFWLIDIADICRSDFVLVLGRQADEPLRGALVEAGVGIGRGIPVLGVGDAKCFGTWQHHPLVKRFDSLEAVRRYLDTFISY